MMNLAVSSSLRRSVTVLVGVSAVLLCAATFASSAEAISGILGTTGSNPYGIAVDSAGNIYTANGGSGNVSKITPGGTSTILGTTGTNPSGITIDSAGNVYTANDLSFNVSKITPGGTSTILADTGINPLAIAVDSAGNLYTANWNPSNVSKITPTVTNGLPDIFPAPPEKPSVPTAAVGSPGSGTATVTVAANPISAAFGTPSSYTITATEDASKQCVVTSPTTSCSVSGLTVATAYTFTARANLNGWQTAASAPSAAVTPMPSNVFTVTKAKAKITGASIVLTTTAKVPGAGKIVQTATTKKGAKVTTRCRAAKTASSAATYTLT